MAPVPDQAPRRSRRCRQGALLIGQQDLSGVRSRCYLNGRSKAAVPRHLNVRLADRNRTRVRNASKMRRDKCMSQDRSVTWSLHHQRCDPRNPLAGITSGGPDCAPRISICFAGGRAYPGSCGQEWEACIPCSSCLAYVLCSSYPAQEHASALFTCGLPA